MSHQQSANDVFAFANSFSEIAHLKDELRKSTRNMTDILSTCGSCRMWMTKACKKERHDNTTGRNYGPNSITIKCGEFEISQLSAKSVNTAKLHIADLQQKLQKATGCTA